MNPKTKDALFLILNKRAEVVNQLILKAWEDREFKQELLSNPKAVYAKEFGHELPENFEIKVIEETPNTLKIVLPCEPTSTPKSDATIDELLKALLKALAFSKTATQLETLTVLKQQLTAQSEQVLDLLSTTPEKLATSELIFPVEPQLKEVFDFIEINYHQPINLNDVAKTVGYSPAYLTDLVRRQTGKSVCRWITERRLVAGCSLLLKTNQSVEQIAEAVGYKNVGCFFRQFRLNYGMTPKAWQKAQLESYVTDA